MDARDYNLCLSADHNDIVIARNHGLGFYDNRTVTGEFLWVCEQLGYVKERTCKIERIEHDEYGEYYYTSCGHCTVSHSHVPCFCSECGSRVVGHETRNMSDKENACEGCAIPNRDYGHAPSPCNFCARNAEERYDLYTPAKVVE